MLCRLAKAAGKTVPNLTHQGCKEVTADPDTFWNRFTDCIGFSKRTVQSRRRFHHEVSTDAVSVSVCMFQPALPSSVPQPATAVKGKKRKRQQQDATEWVKGLASRNLGQTDRFMGLDPGRRSLFTAAIHSEPAANSLHGGRHRKGNRRAQYKTLSWSSSRWRKASGIKFRLHKTEMWLSRDPALKAALQEMPSAKVAGTAAFCAHISHRIEHAPAVRDHFGDRRHRQLRWSTFIKRQRAYADICKDITAGKSSTVVASGDAKFGSSCNKGNLSTPTVSLRRALGRQCRVYDTDVFRTSRLCFACKTAMNGMPLPLLGNSRPLAYTARLLRTCICHADIRWHSQNSILCRSSHIQHMHLIRGTE